MPDKTSNEINLLLIYKHQDDYYTDFDEDEPEDEAIEQGIYDDQIFDPDDDWVEVQHKVERIEELDFALDIWLGMAGEYDVQPGTLRIQIKSKQDQVYDQLPDLPTGACLVFRFADGDFGAALVLKRSDMPIAGDHLLGILDYKEKVPPGKSVFAQRDWLITTQPWRPGEPYLIWVSGTAELQIKVVGNVELREDDLRDCPVGTVWDSFPEYVLYERTFQGK